MGLELTQGRVKADEGEILKNPKQARQKIFSNRRRRRKRKRRRLSGPGVGTPDHWVIGLIRPYIAALGRTIFPPNHPAEDLGLRDRGGEQDNYEFAAGLECAPHPLKIQKRRRAQPQE